MLKQLPSISMLARLSLFIIAFVLVNVANAEDLGVKVYDKYCTPCHGENGDANTAASRALNPMPRNFTEADFINDLTRKRVIDAVTNGRPGTAMVGWQKRLSAKQIEAVSDYVRERFAHGESQSQQCSTCHNETDHDALGERVYQTRCYFCHGYDGRANTEAAQYLSPAPRNLRGLTMSLTALSEVISAGKVGTAMMPFANTLSDREIEAVARYIDKRFVKRKVEHVVESYHSVKNGWSFAYGSKFAGIAKSDACLTCHEAKKPTTGLVWQSNPSD